MTQDKTDLPGPARRAHDPVSFGERMAGSDSFMGLFRDGMGLLEETADYLDGTGRNESRALGRLGGLAYATESMKLTTRLMQVASWLLLQRAVNDGEMSPVQAAEEKGKVRLEHPEDRERVNGYAELPDGLKELIARSLRLQARVRHLDSQLRGGNVPDTGERKHPVFAQIDKVRSAFASPDA